MQTTTVSGMGSVLLDAFPNWHAFPDTCNVRMSIEEDQASYADVLSIVREHGGYEGLIERLRTQHPTRRKHNRQHDRRTFDVFREAAGFAWVAKDLGAPEFTDDFNKPDLYVPESAWIEAKSLHRPNEEVMWAEDVAAGPGVGYWGPEFRNLPPDALIRKLASQLQDSKRKFTNVPAAPVHLAYVMVDLSFRSATQETWQQLRDCARRWAEGNNTVVVLVDGWEGWANPKYVFGLANDRACRIRRDSH